MKKYILFIFIVFYSRVVFCQYKTAENYIIVEIDVSKYHPTTYIIYGGYNYNDDNYHYSLISSGEVFMVSEKDILSFLKENRIDKSKLILLLHQELPFIPASNNVLKEKCLIDWTNIFEFLWLVDTPIYKIGDKMYVIRKIKYAYFDGVDAYARKDQLFKTDDIQTDYIDTTLVSAKKYYNVNYFQNYLFTMELMPNHKKLKKYFWKKRYELLKGCLYEEYKN